MSGLWHGTGVSAAPRPRLDPIFGVGESAERRFPGQESASPENPAETAMSV